MKNLKISIITISYNNEKDIRKTIESVVNQTYKNIEYIVVDGKSSDNTLGIVNEYKDKIARIISEKDKNLYDAINKGIKMATGDIVGLIHAGDRLFDKNVIVDIANFFLQYKIDALYGHSYLVNKNDIPVRINKSPNFRKSLFKIGWMPSHQSIYIKRSIFDKLGLYRTDIGGSGDYEFVLRYFFFNNLTFKLFDRFIVRFALGGTSTSNYHKILKTQMTHVKCWKINGQSPPFYMVPLKLLRKVKQFTSAYFFNLKQKNVN